MRIDSALCDVGFFDSRNKAKESILRGEIYYDGQQISKPSFNIDEKNYDKLSVRRVATEFVSVGGYKLEKALNDFDLSVENLICADIGASTGGFTDCLLQRGAKTVYAVDLNDLLLSDKLKRNVAVKQLIKNARYLKKTDFAESIDLLVADLSFISETYVLPVFSELLNEGKRSIVLIKPQFENDGKIKYKNGIVNDKNKIFSAIYKVAGCAASCGLFPEKLTTAPIVSRKNTEYLILFTKKNSDGFNVDEFMQKNKNEIFGI